MSRDLAVQLADQRSHAAAHIHTVERSSSALWPVAAHGVEALAVAASTPARMSDRPLVYYAARCSGGTAIHAILRDLLVLHGVHRL